MSTKTAQTSAQDDVFDHNIRHLKISLTYVDALAKRPLTSSRFVRPVDRFVRNNLREQVEKHKEKLNLVDLRFPFPEFSHLSSRAK